jgi:hypothetical protein
MGRCVLIPLLLLGLTPLFSWGQSPAPPPADIGTFLGLLFSAIPEARYQQEPQLPRKHGVLVTHVLPNSPAAKADLQRDDVLLEYDAHKIHDAEQLARLIRDDRAGRKVKLVFHRAGKEMTAEATLTLGPVLQLSASPRGAFKDASGAPRGVARTSGPPAVSVAATPQADGSVKLTIEYYQDGFSRPRSVVCSGSPGEIDRQLEKLPSRVQELTRVALDRIRALELQKTSQPRSTPSSQP